MIKSKTLASAFSALAISFATLGGAIAIQATTTQAQAQTVLISGSWTKKSFKVSGQWSIVEENGTRYVKLSDDFKTRNAPDLKIFLSPTSASSANGKNATDGSILISELSSNRGGQTYEIPADVDLSDYASILIHCEAYSKLWSASDLS